MGEPLRPEDFVGYRLVRLADRLGRRFAEDLAPLGLTARQFSVLAVLAGNPGMTSAEVARAVLTTPQSTGPLLDQLAGRGLVERGGTRGRGRAAPVRPTPEGLRLLGLAGTRVAAQDAELRSRLGRQDTAGLLALLDRLEDAVPD